MSKWLDLSLTCTQLNFNQSVTNTYNNHSPMNLIVDLYKNQRYGQLYLGNINAANDIKYLREHSINAIVAVIDTSEIRIDPTMTRLWIMAEDAENFDLYRYFDECANFIRDHIKNTNVFVHCYAGISRSASVVIAYMIKHLGYSLKEALRKVKGARSIVEPNSGFMKQLQDYEYKQNLNSHQGTRNGSSFHSNPRGSVTSATKGSLHSAKPSFLDRMPSGSKDLKRDIESPCVSQFYVNGSSKQTNNNNNNPKSFFKQGSVGSLLKQTNNEDFFRRYQKQKNVENIWNQGMHGHHKSAFEIKCDKIEQVKLTLQTFGVKNVFNSSNSNGLHFHHKGLSQG
ncbi:unnamed protein product [Paramecium sonneborni]|uniref:Protein-tyrosine-phosphatase n=1 Tax=Paramecium sonneborni TaxID=65129 RepID=A0A8S1RCZ2_9CILI|nr:unnamed protein product [Paramecium sonneborni]